MKKHTAIIALLTFTFDACVAQKINDNLQSQSIISKLDSIRVGGSENSIYQDFVYFEDGYFNGIFKELKYFDHKYQLIQLTEYVIQNKISVDSLYLDSFASLNLYLFNKSLGPNRIIKRRIRFSEDGNILWEEVHSADLITITTYHKRKKKIKMIYTIE